MGQRLQPSPETSGLTLETRSAVLWATTPEQSLQGLRTALRASCRVLPRGTSTLLPFIGGKGHSRRPETGRASGLQDVNTPAPDVIVVKSDNSSASFVK